MRTVTHLFRIITRNECSAPFSLSLSLPNIICSGVCSLSRLPRDVVACILSVDCICAHIVLARPHRVRHTIRRVPDVFFLFILHQSRIFVHSLLLCFLPPLTTCAILTPSSPIVTPSRSRCIPRICATVRLTGEGRSCFIFPSCEAQWKGAAVHDNETPLL